MKDTLLVHSHDISVDEAYIQWMLNGQNHKGSTYHIGRMIVDKIEGKNEITEFFFPKDLNHFCAGCYQCIEDVSACPYYEEKRRSLRQ